VVLQGIAALISVAWLQCGALLCLQLQWLNAQYDDGSDIAVHAARAVSKGQMLLQGVADAGAAECDSVAEYCCLQLAD
jgi:hypothetical protein